jgi:hypothetical protein
MGRAEYPDQASVPPPAYHRALAGALHLDALTALAAWQAGRPELIRSPRLVLAHVWEVGAGCATRWCCPSTR